MFFLDRPVDKDDDPPLYEGELSAQGSIDVIFRCALEWTRMTRRLRAGSGGAAIIRGGSGGRGSCYFQDMLGGRRRPPLELEIDQSGGPMLTT